MKLLLDEHYAREIAVRLRDAGHDVVTVAECGMAGVDDAALLRFATSELRTLLTNNVRHFVPLTQQLAASGEDHHGLLFTSDASLPRGKATIGRYVTALRDVMERHEALVNQVRWLT